MRTGRLAREIGVNVQTLRYYERRGLLPEPRRTPGGFRDYDDTAVALLRAVRAAQRLGFTLSEIAGLLGRGRRRAGLQEAATTKLAEIEERMAALAVARAGLREVVRSRCADLVDCTCHPPAS
jgi:DNA-binding transcriptional MerR regulator